jgi:hypothetical protein
MREVIDFLVLEECLVHGGFESRAAPHDGPVFAFRVADLSETVIFKGISDNSYIIL